VTVAGTAQEAGGISRRVQAVLTAALLLANLIGAVVVVALATFVIPGPTVFSGSAAPVTFVVLPLYIVAALAGGTLVGTRGALHVLDWVKLERTPTPAEAEAAFAVPARLVVVQATLWAVAVALFTTLYGLSSAQNLPRVAFPITFGGSWSAPTRSCSPSTPSAPSPLGPCGCQPPIGKRESGPGPSWPGAWARGCPCWA
jgi:adenylate cyclase